MIGRRPRAKCEQVRLSAPSGKERIILQVDPSGEASFRILGKDGKTAVSVAHVR
jgi:hypothetical protein